MDTVTTEDKEMTATGADGVPIKFIGKVITTDHHVIDEDGNPKISVEVKVPSTIIGITPGEIQ